MLLVTHIFLFVFGLALFMFGMKCMTRALEKHTGDRLRNSLARLTSSSFKGLCLGAGVTAVIQSSSAVTVMLVGLVNAGILTLRETVGVIMGANIGTTATSWILSLVGMKGRGLLSILVNSYTIAAASALCGLLLYFFQKRKKKGLAACCFGFALLMCGMELMSYSLSPLRDVPQTAQVLTLFSNPFYGLLAGTAVTAVLQSSSASVGLLQGAVAYGDGTLCECCPYCNGAEHRHVRHGAHFLHRNEQKRQTHRVYPFIFQYHRRAVLARGVLRMRYFYAFFLYGPKRLA